MKAPLLISYLAIEHIEFEVVGLINSTIRDILTEEEDYTILVEGSELEIEIKLRGGAERALTDGDIALRG